MVLLIVHKLILYVNVYHTSQMQGLIFSRFRCRFFFHNFKWLTSNQNYRIELIVSIILMYNLPRKVQAQGSHN